MSTMTYTGTLVIIECYKCHIVFAMPKDLQRRARQDNSVEFWCPLGHGQVYATSEADRLREELERAQRQLDWAETARKAARDQAETAEYRRRAAQGQLTKIRKRVAAGVCPECHRTFTTLASHMASKHPGFKADETGTPPARAEASGAEIRRWARRKGIVVSDRGRIPESVRERYGREAAQAV